MDPNATAGEILAMREGAFARARAVLADVRSANGQWTPDTIERALVSVAQLKRLLPDPEAHDQRAGAQVSATELRLLRELRDAAFGGLRDAFGDAR